jgi:Cu/Ag efflux pump CusA
MLGLGVLVGIVIDDAIVILENIHRTMEEKGLERRKSRELRHRGDRPRRHGHDAFAGRHLPAAAFMKGRVGMFFSSYGVTVAFAIIVSLFRLVHAHADAGVAFPAATRTIQIAREKGARRSAHAVARASLP